MIRPKALFAAATMAVASLAAPAFAAPGPGTIWDNVEQPDADRMVLAFKTWNGNTTLTISGRLEYGDEARVAKAFYNADRGVVGMRPIRWVYLNSYGGNVDASRKIAAIFLERSVNVVVDNGRRCASACVLMFAAGTSRWLHPQGGIGVHSISVAGEETGSTMAGTTELARLYKMLNVPAAVIGRMVSTPPEDMAWLRYSELGSWVRGVPTNQ